MAENEVDDANLATFLGRLDFFFVKTHSLQEEVYSNGPSLFHGLHTEETIAVIANVCLSLFKFF